MAGPNAQLDAALARFAAQPGVTAEAATYLRSVASSDPERLARLNRQASAGELRGFAPEPAGAAQAGIGSYDKATGVVTLPYSSAQPGDAAARRDLQSVLGLQAIIVDFAHRTWPGPTGQQQVSQEMVDNLQAIFDHSPVLADKAKAAVMLGHVQHFSLLDSAMAAGATYDGSTHDGTPKGINLPPHVLQRNSPANPQGRYDPADLTFVLGHEIEHGFNDAAKDRATGKFLHDIEVQAQQKAPVHDYSDELRAYIQAGREDEARAQIAGWNALLSREQQRVPGANLDHMLRVTRNDRVRDFLHSARSGGVAVAAPNPGLSFNPDGSLSQTPGNIAAMGQHYFDRPAPAYAQPGQRPVALGEHRPASADYTNYYGTWAVERIVAAEDRASLLHRGQRPRIAIDMAGLGMREDLIEMEGLDLGVNRSPRPYIDTSRTPAALGHFHHTQDGSMGHDHRHVPVARIQPLRASGDAVVDAWMEALLAGDDAAARAVQRRFADSAEGQRLWAEGTGAAGRHLGHDNAFDAPSSYAAPWIAAEPHAQSLPQPQHAMER